MSDGTMAASPAWRSDAPLTGLPPPLTPSTADLRDFPHTPLFRSRLFGSSFHARSTDSEWRAGVTLWLKSWDQTPAGSLPDDDIELCRLAELGRDLKLWNRLKVGALRGWVRCSDGRLYHPVVAEGVNNAIEAKLKQRLKTAKARIAALEKHLREAKTKDDKERITEEIERIRQTLKQSQSHGLSQSLNQSPREGEGEVEGKEKEKGSDTSAPIGAGGDAAEGSGALRVIETGAALTAQSRGLSDAEERVLWNAALALLIPSYATGSDKTKDAKARAFVGGLGKRLKDAGVERHSLFDVIQAACVERPANPETWMSAAVATRTGSRKAPNRQEALEQRNHDAAEDWAARKQRELEGANATE